MNSNSQTAPRAFVAQADAQRQRRDVGETFTEPRANRIIMTISLFLIRHLGYVGLPFLRYIPGLQRLIPFVRAMDIDGVDLSPRDVAAVKTTQAQMPMFLAPNHPELFTDWLIDWDVTSRIAPKCAFWGGFDIVNGPLRAFWLQHNLIANTPGGGGKDFSVKAAARGDGVLIHPEGDVAFTARTLQPVFHGVADLAMRTATEGEQKKAAIVPLIYRYRFVGDASAALGRRITALERRLPIPRTAGLPLSVRFAAFQDNVLRHVAECNGLAAPPGPLDTYFSRQASVVAGALDALEATYGVPPSERDELGRVRRLQKALRAKRRQVGGGEQTFQIGMRRVDAVLALIRFSAEAYGHETLTLEQIGESLTRLRGALVRDSWLDGLRAFMPFGVAPRRAHVRVLPPVVVEAYDGSTTERKGRVNDVLQQYATAMREGLAALDAEFHDADQARSVPNRLAAAAPAQRPTGPLHAVAERDAA